MTRSEWANNLINDVHFVEVMTELKELQLNRIENSKERDVEEREVAYTQLKALQNIVSHVESLASQRIINEKRWRIFQTFLESVSQAYWRIRK